MPIRESFFMRQFAFPRRLGIALASVTALAGSLLTATPAQAGNPVTPGDFTGFGFDQCLAPTQKAMDTWWLTSPYAAIGIYVSGDSRACRNQPNLTPTWISKQLSTGWRLLPITLGPQASCTTRDRYKKQVRISASSTNSYAAAKAQGVAEASKTVQATNALGIAPGSTQWYDIEAFNATNTSCRESAKAFLSGWTEQLHQLGFKSGVYSSAASGIKMIDDARLGRTTRMTLPDQLWIADWNGKNNVYSSYISNDGWMPHSRVHQYLGGHNATYGGVTINIDTNWLDVGRGSTPGPDQVHCGGVNYNFTSYYRLYAKTPHRDQVKTLQCMLNERGLYHGAVNGVWSSSLVTAINKFRASKHWRTRNDWTKPSWMALIAADPQPVVKYGSAGPAVRTLQRALNAAGVSQVAVTGVMTQPTVNAVKAYQKRLKLKQYGVMTPYTWSAVTAGRR